MSTRVHVPANLAAGTYKLSLWMPDAASTLKNDPRYSIQMANDGVWNATAGDNKMTNVVVSTSAPGAVSSSTTLSVL